MSHPTLSELSLTTLTAGKTDLPSHRTLGIAFQTELLRLRHALTSLDDAIGELRVPDDHDDPVLVAPGVVADRILAEAGDALTALADGFEHAWDALNRSQLIWLDARAVRLLREFDQGGKLDHSWPQLIRAGLRELAKLPDILPAVYETMHDDAEPAEPKPTRSEQLTDELNAEFYAALKRQVNSIFAATVRTVEDAVRERTQETASA